METAELLREFKENHAAVMAKFTEAETTATKANARLVDLEQKLARRAGGGGNNLETKSAGQTLVESEEFKALALASVRTRQAGQVYK